AQAMLRAVLRPLPRSLRGQARFVGGIKILAESGKAKETSYWAQEDERLIKKMLANHPELDPQLMGIASILSDAANAKMEDK
ncbi:unnamed protein product, partial [Polarella glacialis]